MIKEKFNIMKIRAALGLDFKGSYKISIKNSAGRDNTLFKAVWNKNNKKYSKKIVPVILRKSFRMLFIGFYISLWRQGS